MCSTFKNGDRVLKPRSIVEARGSTGALSAVWAGFARSEILSWWKRQGAIELDIEATEFAERSDKTGELVWGAVPEGLVLRAVLDARGNTPLLKVVTRQATDREMDIYGHRRMPVLDRPLHTFHD
jgi:hypothetical protein